MVIIPTPYNRGYTALEVKIWNLSTDILKSAAFKFEILKNCTYFTALITINPTLSNSSPNLTAEMSFVFILNA